MSDSNHKQQPIIRPMLASDVEQVHAIEVAAQIDPWRKLTFEDCLRVGYLAWVMELNGSVIGFAILNVAVEEGHILDFCIDPSVQGQGFGRLLLAHFLQDAKSAGAKRVILEVRASNEIARSLYISFGFAQIGVRENYYKTKTGYENALVLAFVC